VFLGTPAIGALGAATVTAMYFASGLAGSAAFLASQYYQMRASPFEARRHASRRALGASGAVNGMVAYSILMNPMARILVFFVIPMPAWAFGIVVLGRDVLGASSVNSSVGHMSHLAGAAVGALTFVATRGRG